MQELADYHTRLLNNHTLQQQFLRLTESGPNGTFNNRYLQYYRSIWEEHTTTHGWLRLYLNLQADLLDPDGRHWYLPDKPPLPEEKKSRVGIIPMISSAYYQLMKDSNTLPHIPKKTSKSQALQTIHETLGSTFCGKHVFLAPGRAGYEAKLLLTYRPARISVLTSGSYLDLARKILSRKQNTQKIPIRIINARMEEIITAMTIKRPLRNYLNPDITFITNMCNDKRFNDPTSDHHIPINWQTSLNRSLAVGQLNTRFAITPAIDFKPVFTPKALSAEIGGYTSISFYQSDADDPSVVASEGDFAFIATLTKPVPSTKL